MFELYSQATHGYYDEEVKRTELKKLRIELKVLATKIPPVTRSEGTISFHNSG